MAPLLAILIATWMQDPVRGSDERLTVPRDTAGVVEDASALVGSIAGDIASGKTYDFTGADSCEDALQIPILTGPRGNPTITTIIGSNVAATAMDCPLFGSDPVWWEAFTIDQCARVTLDFCGTLPVQQPSYAVLLSGCPCGDLVLASAGARGAPFCMNNKQGERENLWITFDALSPGTYFYPVYSNEDSLVNGRGPYQIHIRVDECHGSCCESETGACREDVSEAGCAGVGERFSGGLACCEVECRSEKVAFDASGVELLSLVGFDRFPPGTYQTSDLSRYVSPTGREYAIVGFTTGTGFVEVTRPAEPVVVGWIDGMGVDTVWRDPAAYQGFAYIVTDGIGVGLQVVDVRKIDQGTVSLVHTTRLLDDSFYTAHNLFINEASGFAYLTGANYPTGGLVAVDLANPINPTVAGYWSEVYVHDAQVVTLTQGENAGREIAFAFAGGEGLVILDVTNKSDIHKVGQLYYEGLSYCHQGWLSADERMLFVDDELDEVRGTTNSTTTYVVDVSDLANPMLLHRFGNGGCAVDHNLMVRAGTVYEANYSTGLRVFDVSDPMAPSEVGHFDTHPEDNISDFVGAWGVEARFPSGILAVSDIERGLFVFNYDCDNNGQADSDELVSKAAQDCNANRLPDHCEFIVFGDLDRDRRVAVSDQPMLTLCLSGPCVGVPCVPLGVAQSCCPHADLDGDGDVDLGDVGVLYRSLTGR